MSNPDPARAEGLIELKIHNFPQLFHTLDPSPFREGDLDLEAEDYIVEQAEELPKNAPIRLIIHVEERGSHASDPDVAAAIRSHFLRCASHQSRKLKSVFAEGRRSLVIGLSILSVCILIGLLIVRIDSALAEIVKESFLIFGWVAIWKPSEIFLYAWPPIANRRRLYVRLSNATVEIRHSRDLAA